MSGHKIIQGLKEAIAFTRGEGTARVTVIDRLYAFQARQIHEYECHSCGRYTRMDHDNEKTIIDQGEREDVLICDRCLALGWNHWGKP